MLNKISKEKALMHTMSKRYRKWVRITLRGNSLLRTDIEGKVKGKRKRGRIGQIVLWIGYGKRIGNYWSGNVVKMNITNR